MPITVKELIVVLFIAGVVFVLARPVALRFMNAADFARRRNVWLVLTITAFLAPNFWIFVLVAAPLLLWATHRDTNPIALYLLMLQVVPSVDVQIPAIGVHALFGLDIYRLLAFCVLIPTALRYRRSKESGRLSRFDSMDYLLLGFGILQVVFYVRPDLAHATAADLQDSATNTLRRGFLFFLDVYVLYFAVRRSCINRSAIVDALASFSLAGVILGLIGAFETLRQWLLYTDLMAHWGGNPLFTSYLLRAGTLRAQASAGDPLALGYWEAIAFGFWLYLRHHIPGGAGKYAIAFALWLGLLAAYSRGPWLGALAVYFIFAALRPKLLSSVMKAAGVGILVFAALLVSPLGSKIISVLPFMGGSIDSGSLTYRQALAQRSWELILQHPFLGDQFVYSKMEDLRQGQGIIDLVNTYIQVTLFYGFVGTSLFLGFIFAAFWRAYRASRLLAKTNPDIALLGATLVACLLGTLVMLADCSFILDYQKCFYVLAGLAAAYSRFAYGRQAQPSPVRASGRLTGQPSSTLATNRRFTSSRY